MLATARTHKGAEAYYVEPLATRAAWEASGVHTTRSARPLGLRSSATTMPSIAQRSGRCAKTMALNAAAKAIASAPSTRPVKPMPQSARNVRRETPVQFETPDGRLTLIPQPASPGVLLDTSRAEVPRLLTTVPGFGGGFNGDAVLLGHALFLGNLGAINVWDLSGRQATTRATA